MESIETKISGCFRVKLNQFKDHRGSLTKIFQNSVFQKHFPDFLPREIFISQSHQGVLRGLHFQKPPNDQIKAVMCVAGSVFDVVLDLRKNSPSYRTCVSLDLNESDPLALLIPRGCAHGFYVTSPSATLLYITETEYDQTTDSGILWSSVNTQWPFQQDPILSDRDRALPEFDSSFD